MPCISLDRGQGTKLPTKGRILRACRVPFSRYSLLINNWISWYISAIKQVKRAAVMCAFRQGTDSEGSSEAADARCYLMLTRNLNTHTDRHCNGRSEHLCFAVYHCLQLQPLCPGPVQRRSRPLRTATWIKTPGQTNRENLPSTVFLVASRPPSGVEGSHQEGCCQTQGKEARNRGRPCPNSGFVEALRLRMLFFSSFLSKGLEPRPSHKY